jgi:hypothetical protein
VTSQAQQASRRQERQVAKILDGTRNAGSGNQWLHPNDIRNERFSVECKTTSKKSYSLTAATLKKAETNALLEGRDMVLVIEIEGRNWAVVDLAVLEALTG